MNYAFRFASLLLVAALALVACNKNKTVSQSSAEQPSPVAAFPSLSPSASPKATPTATSTLTQGYQEPKGAFKIGLPSNYTYKATETGVIFQSTDETFRGEVVFGSAQGSKFTNQELESFLKEAYKENLKLTDVKWQQTEAQSDGSLRIDWVGKDPQGNVLDAESFIEQRGDTIYILTLSGINKPYLDYLADAQAIVGSYEVKQDENADKAKANTDGGSSNKTSTDQNNSNSQ
ncbi:MAG TPA: hypothetical protein V6C65_32380 [Allocoleopsis sp.]